MFDGIDKLPIYFMSIFHGIVTAYLVYLFTDIEISDTYFIIFVIFCCTLNIIIVRLALAAIFLFPYINSRSLYNTTTSPERKLEYYGRMNKYGQRIRSFLAFSADDLLTKPTVIYFFLCLIASLFSAALLSHAYQYDWAFRLARIWDWPKQSSRGIVEDFFARQCNAARARDPRSDCMIDEYMEVWWKGTGIVSVGFISQKPEGYRGKQFVQLSDACQLALNNGELRYPTGKVEYKPGVTAFVDVNDPGVMLVQIVPAPNPCVLAASK